MTERKQTEKGKTTIMWGRLIDCANQTTVKRLASLESDGFYVAKDGTTIKVKGGKVVSVVGRLYDGGYTGVNEGMLSCNSLPFRGLVSEIENEKFPVFIAYIGASAEGFGNGLYDDVQRTQALGSDKTTLQRDAIAVFEQTGHSMYGRKLAEDQRSVLVSAPIVGFWSI
jgi:hypothetical protein